VPLASTGTPQAATASVELVAEDVAAVLPEPPYERNAWTMSAASERVKSGDPPALFPPPLPDGDGVCPLEVPPLTAEAESVPLVPSVPPASGGRAP
jgi:hypothetical protein